MSKAKAKVPAPRTSAPSAKILGLDALAAQVHLLKTGRKRIVHCHGVFDLMHVGHIRHFTEAKAMGDVLVVTLTPDHFVNKGPHRPAFPQNLRAEVIAALDMVDFVAVNLWPNAIETIKRLRPDVYAKGPDYKDAAKDVTGGISLEEKAVQAVGGELRLTSDITFSSSNLLNLHMSQYAPPVAAYLANLRRRFTPGTIASGIKQLRKLKVLVVGEAILDEYVYCETLGKSSKEPILAMQFIDKDIHAGGALAVANHVAEFAGQVDLVTYLGDRQTEEDFVRRNLKPNVKPRFIMKPDSPTIVKRRFVDKYLVTKMLEIYEMNDTPLSGAQDDELCSLLAKSGGYDVVIVADFGHGLLGPRAIEALSKSAKFLSVMTQINAANRGFHTISKYKRADYICIQEGEIRLDHRDRHSNLKSLIKEMAKRLSADTVMVTRGKTGTLIYAREAGFSDCPSFAVQVVDRIGAGDSVLAVTSLAAAAELPPELIGFLGNLAGAQAVTIVGNSASISRVAMLKSVDSLLK